MKLIISLTIMVTSTMTLYGQVSDAEQEALTMKDELSLTDEQYSNLVETLGDYYQVRRTSNAATATWESNEDFIDSLETVKRNEVRQILTDEQFARWEQKEDKHESGTSDRQQAIEEANEMKERLQLSEDQRQALEELTFQHLQYMQKMKGVQRNSGQLQPRVFLRAKSEYRSALADILSAEQFEKWKAVSGEIED